jgi:hypothetical protein
MSPRDDDDGLPVIAEDVVGEDDKAVVDILRLALVIGFVVVVVVDVGAIISDNDRNTIGRGAQLLLLLLSNGLGSSSDRSCRRRRFRFEEEEEENIDDVRILVNRLCSSCRGVPKTVSFAWTVSIVVGANNSIPRRQPMLVACFNRTFL